MNISAIRNSLLGTTIALAAISCNSKKEENIARDRIIPYVSGTELFLADSVLNARANESFSSTKKQSILYWDSIIAEGKAKEAYFRGMKMVEDSAAGKPYSKENFSLPIDTVVKASGDDIIKSLKKEVASMVDGKTYNEQLKNQPDDTPKFDFTNIHYYGILLRTAKEREAYNRGADIARLELKNKTK